MRTLTRLTRSLAGPSKVRLDLSIPNHVSSLTVHAVHGYDVTIYCEATYFVRTYKRPYVPNRNMAVYRLSATVAPDAPDRLKEAASLFSVTVPRECMMWLWRNETYQKQRAIEAYLDLLLAKLDRRQQLDREYDYR